MGHTPAQRAPPGGCSRGVGVFGRVRLEAQHLVCWGGPWDGYYFVTSRCFQGRLLVRPSAEVNELVRGVLARAVQQSAGPLTERGPSPGLSVH
jgi:hypothetical protein